MMHSSSWSEKSALLFSFRSAPWRRLPRMSCRIQMKVFCIFGFSCCIPVRASLRLGGLIAVRIHKSIVSSLSSTLSICLLPYSSGVSVPCTRIRIWVSQSSQIRIPMTENERDSLPPPAALFPFLHFRFGLRIRRHRISQQHISENQYSTEVLGAYGHN